MEKLGQLGAVRGHLRSSAMSPFDRAHTTSYSTLIETVRLSCTVFTARRNASALYTMALCLCLSQVAVLLKWLNTGSHKQNHTIAQGLQFFGAKDLREILPGSPPTGAQNAGGWVKIGEFRQIAGYISKTVQDRGMVSMKVEQEVKCALSNGDIADDIE